MTSTPQSIRRSTSSSAVFIGLPRMSAFIGFLGCLLEGIGRTDFQRGGLAAVYRNQVVLGCRVAGFRLRVPKTWGSEI